MTLPTIADSEDLGRCCFDRKQAHRNRPRIQFIKRSFDRGPMSVDRLQRADERELSQIHDEEAAKRSLPRDFHGWYVFTAGIVRSAGWDVRLDPTTINACHAQVHLQCLASDHEDAFITSCQKVASLSHWRDRPLTQDTESFLRDVSSRLS